MMCSVRPPQVIRALKTGGEQAWDHAGVNFAFEKMGAVPARVSRKARVALYGLKAWNELPVRERAKHGWDCEACARSAQA